jgi:hypothetical protein
MEGMVLWYTEKISINISLNVVREYYKGLSEEIKKLHEERQIKGRVD